MAHNNNYSKSNNNKREEFVQRSRTSGGASTRVRRIRDELKMLRQIRSLYDIYALS